MFPFLATPNSFTPVKQPGVGSQKRALRLNVARTLRVSNFPIEHGLPTRRLRRSREAIRLLDSLDDAGVNYKGRKALISDRERQMKRSGRETR